jgi:predicted phosphoribosyltransferase
LNEDVVGWYHVPAEVIEQVAEEEQRELERREISYRAGRPSLVLRDRVVILVDDGLATGSTMKAAVKAVRAYRPSRVVVAVPVGAPETCREIGELADEVICGQSPESFSAVGQWYRDFSQTTDDEVHQLLREALTAKSPNG